MSARYKNHSAASFKLKGLNLFPLSCLFFWMLTSFAGDSDPAQSYQPPPAENYSKFSQSEAFDKLHAKFSKEYAFTKWKDIDWDALYTKFKPRIDQAQNSENFDDYYITLREYIHSVPDNHIDVSHKPDIDKKYIGGGLGFSVTKLSDGTVIASWVDKAGPAYSQGMLVGAEIIKWDNQPVANALKETSIIFGRSNPATEEGLEYEKTRYLTRAPVGNVRSLSFTNIGESEEKSITLTAYDDEGESLSKSYPYTVISDGIREVLSGILNPGRLPEAMVETKILDGNIGYLRIWGEIDLDLKNTKTAPSTLKLFKDAINKFNASKVVGIILDVRNNLGGSDFMVTEILSSFYSVKTFYEYQNYLNATNGSWEIWVSNETPEGKPPFINPGQGLYIEPSSPFFSGPVVVITNTKCTSSGEGIALGIKNLPNEKGKTVGFYGTNGSFGMTGGSAIMPGDLEVKWPIGQSLDKNKCIQLDSREGIGGVSPSIRTPMTLENTLDIAKGIDVELEHAKQIINASQHDKTLERSRDCAASN